jgi:hypothetical protein
MQEKSPGREMTVGDLPLREIEAFGPIEVRARLRRTVDCIGGTSEVNIDNGVVSKTEKAIPSEALTSLLDNIENVPGVPVPVFPRDRLINYWKVLDTEFNPVSQRVLLSSRVITDLGGPFITTEDPSSQAQALIQLLDQYCVPLER